MNKSRIFIGPSNTAGLSGSIAKALRTVGIKADFVKWRNSTHPFGYGIDKQMWLLSSNPPFKIFGKNQNYWLNLILRFFHFIRMLFLYNTFIFIKPDTFFRNNKDLYILKILRKKIIFMFVGCNDRDPNFMPKDQDYCCNTCKDKEKQINNWCDRLEDKKNRVRWFEKFAYKVIAFDDNASYLSNKSKQVWLSAAVESPLKKDYLKKFDEKKIVICHLPSNPLVKQTHIIEPILKRISEEENVEVIIKKDFWSREKILKTLEKSHINIDALGGMIFGTIAIEGNVRGAVGLSSYPNWIAKHYDIAPVVGITSDSLYGTLKELIHNKYLMKQYAKRLQDAYNKYFTYEAVGKYYEEMLNLR